MPLDGSTEPRQPAAGASADLCRHYRSIGIGAVRAALRYCGERKDAPADRDRPVRDLEPQRA